MSSDPGAMTTTVFLLQAACSMIASILLYVRFVAPWLRTKPATTVLIVLLLPNLFRHIGFATVSPDVVGADFAREFGHLVAFGDGFQFLVTCAAVVALHRGSRLVKALCWLFTLTGLPYDATIGYLMATAPFSVAAQMRTHWYVATMVVPVLSLTEILILVELIRRRGELPRATGPTRHDDPPAAS